MEIGSHVLIKNSEEESEEEEDDPKDTSDVPHEAPPSTAATMDIKTPPPDQEVIEEPEQPSTRARDYLLRLKVEMAGLWGDVTFMIGELSIIRRLLERGSTSEALPADDTTIWDISSMLSLCVFAFIFRLVH